MTKLLIKWILLAILGFLAYVGGNALSAYLNRPIKSGGIHWFDPNPNISNHSDLSFFSFC